jgi:hypothetical protein
VKRVWVVQVFPKRCQTDSFWLGSTFSTRDKAEAHGKKEVCSRCNTFSPVPIPDNYIWISGKIGFQIEDRLDRKAYDKVLRAESKARRDLKSRLDGM